MNFEISICFFCIIFAYINNLYNSTNMKNRILYFIILFFSKMPFFMLYKISDFMSFMLTHVIKYRKDVIIENLKNSFPDKTEDEIYKIFKDFNKSFSDQMMETLKMFTISAEELSKRLTYDNAEEMTKYAKEGRSVMLASGHYGNWEYPAGFPFSIPGFDGYNVVYAPISNKFLNDKALQSREQFGCHLIPMGSAIKEIIAQPNYGQVYGFLFDQSPHKGKIKYDLQFLNQTTPVHLGTEQIAKKKNAVVITLEISRIKRGYYRAHSKLVTENPREMPNFEITKELFKRLEETIKKDPSQWLWSHRRWKYKPGVDYNI